MSVTVCPLQCVHYSVINVRYSRSNQNNNAQPISFPLSSHNFVLQCEDEGGVQPYYPPGSIIVWHIHPDNGPAGEAPSCPAVYKPTAAGPFEGKPHPLAGVIVDIGLLIARGIKKLI